MSKFILSLFFLTVLLSSGCQKHYSLFHSKSKWLKDFFAEIESDKYADIYAISYWHEDFGNTYLTINSSKRSLKTYRKLVDNDIFITTCSFDENNKLKPVKNKKYLSAFPYFGHTEDEVTAQKIRDYESLAQKEIAWAYFSNNWLDSLVFPAQSVQIIASEGKTPFIRLMFRSVFEENQPDPKYKVPDILGGKYDSAIVAWAKEARDCGVNLLAEFGTEVNGVWFSWNGSYYGGGTTTGYGDPDYPDGPEIFRDAYRHIIDLCDSVGADNITWFYHFDVNSDPDDWWNQPSYYYPGDDYIDWVGVSTYGPFQRGDEYVKPKDLLEKAYNELKSVSTNKPYAILEFGITEL